MHAGLHFVQRGRGAGAHEVVAMHNASNAKLLVEVAARRRTAPREAQSNELLGEEGFPPLGRVAGAVKTAHKTGAIALRSELRRQLRKHGSLCVCVQMSFARVKDLDLDVLRTGGRE